jgi:hypothetical protein
MLLQSMPCISTLIVYKTVLSTFCVSHNKLGQLRLVWFVETRERSIGVANG